MADEDLRSLSQSGQHRPQRCCQTDRMAGEAAAHVQADSPGKAKGRCGRLCAASKLPVHQEGHQSLFLRWELQTRHNNTMIMPSRLMCIIALAATLLAKVGYSQDAFPFQEWKNKDGKSIEARLHSIPSEGNVTIQLKGSLRKHTLKKADLDSETVDQLENTIDEVRREWNNEDVIPTAQLAYKAAALGLPQRKHKKATEFQYLKVISFQIKQGGREAGAILEGNLAVEYLPTGDVRFFQSGNNLAVKNSSSGALVLATKGAVFPMALSGPMRWGNIGVSEYPIFTKLVSVRYDTDISVDGELLR